LALEKRVNMHAHSTIFHFPETSGRLTNHVMIAGQSFHRLSPSRRDHLWWEWLFICGNL